MPELINLSPFPNFRYYNSDNKGEDFGSIIVKATFDIKEDGLLTVSEEQAPMIFSDKCFGALNKSSLWHPSDLVARKASTDIIINAVAHSPNNELTTDWLCGVSVDGENTKFNKQIRVTGPRNWIPKWKRELSSDEKKEWKKYRDLFVGWELSESKKIHSLPIRYEYAFGDLRQSGVDENGNATFDDHGYNPIGQGWLHPELTDHTTTHPAPQIEAINIPITDPYKFYKPEGLGPIPPAWEPRLPRAGTYDANWLENIWPKWPPDYQFSYNNSAHPDLIMPCYLQGNENITLTGLRPNKNNQIIKLPHIQPTVFFTSEDGSIEEKDMNLDTVFLDIAEINLNECHVFLSWRVHFQPNKFETATILIRDTEGNNHE